MDLKRIIANNIYMIRNKYKLTQQEFVDRLNIGASRGHISNIENGVNIPSAAFIKAVSDTFNVDTNWLLNAHNKEYPNLVIKDEEMEFILEYRMLSEESKQAIANFIKILNSK